MRHQSLFPCMRGVPRQVRHPLFVAFIAAAAAAAAAAATAAVTTASAVTAAAPRQ